jgi:hypothetical protein
LAVLHAAAPSARPGRLCRTVLARHRRLDAVAVIVLALVSAFVAHRYVNEHFAIAYDSAYRDATEDLLFPCVGRAGWTIDPAALEASAHWQDFAQRRVEAIDCARLSGLPRVRAGNLSEIQRYLHASLSAAFSWFGPRRSVYVGYMTAMVALTTVAAYGLIRLGAGPMIAFLATLPFVFSDLHLANALHPAEYVKAPFFLACLLFLGALVRHDRGGRDTRPLAFAAGCLAGIGIGFKTDVLVCVPIGFVAIAAFAGRAQWRQRAIAAGLFLAGVVVSGAPVLKAQFLTESGSLFPVQVLGGMYRNFDDYYAQPSLYDYGIRFDDTHITYVINSYDQRVHGSRSFAEFYSKRLQQAATLMVIDIDRLFPADLLLRTFAAVVNVLKLGRFGLVAAPVVLVGLLLAQPRFGWCAAFFLASAVGYVSLVFQTKHFFHLEWVPWWFTAVAAEQTIALGAAASPTTLGGALDDGRRWLVRRAARIAAVGFVVLLAVLAFVLARQIQQARVTAFITDAMRHAEDEPIAVRTAAAPNGSSLLIADGLGSTPHPTALVEDYLVLDVACDRDDDVTIVAVYEQATSPREPMTVPCARGARQWTVFWPVYQFSPSARLRWFEIPPASPARIASIRRVRDPRDFRLLLKLAVPGDYPHRRWYHRLRRRFFVEPIGVSQSF